MVVWDAAIVLSKYLETIRDQVRDKSVLELGSGTGAVGICAAALGAKQVCHDVKIAFIFNVNHSLKSKVLLTDQDNLVEFLDHNISLNADIISSFSTISALPLVWGNTNQVNIRN